MKTRTAFLAAIVLVFAAGIQPVLGQESAPQPDISPPPSVAASSESGESANIHLRHTRAGVVGIQIRSFCADRDLSLAVNDRTNSILVSGHPEAIVLVKELVASLDQKEDAPFVVAFALKHARAQFVSDQLRQQYADFIAANALSSSVKEQTNSILVHGRPELIAEVKEFVERLDVQENGSLEQLQSATLELAKEYRTLGTGKTLDVSPYESIAVDSSLSTFAEVKREEVSSLKKQKLRDSVEAEFEARQLLQRAELSRLQQELQSIQRQIDTRVQLKDQIIDKRVEELINPVIQWDAVPPRKPLSGSGGQHRQPSTRGGISDFVPKREPWQGDPTTTNNAPAAQPIVASDATLMSEFSQLRRQFVTAEMEFQTAESALNELLTKQKHRPGSGIENAKVLYPTQWQALQQARSTREEVRRLYQARMTLLKLDMDTAETAFQSARTRQDEVENLHKQGNATFPQVAESRAETEAAKNNLQRARTIYELFEGIQIIESFAPDTTSDAKIPLRKSDGTATPMGEVGNQSAVESPQGERKAREVADAFVAAALAGKTADATALTTSRVASSKDWMHFIQQVLNAKSLSIESVRVNDTNTAALAISQQIKLAEPRPDVGDTVNVVLHLAKDGSRWVIRDADINSETAAAEELARFELENSFDTTGDGHWGKEIGGLEMGIRLAQEKKPYRVGDTLTFQMLVQNVTEHPIEFYYTPVSFRGRIASDGIIYITPVASTDGGDRVHRLGPGREWSAPWYWHLATARAESDDTQCVPLAAGTYEIGGSDFSFIRIADGLNNKAAADVAAFDRNVVSAPVVALVPYDTGTAHLTFELLPAADPGAAPSGTSGTGGTRARWLRHDKHRTRLQGETNEQEPSK